MKEELFIAEEWIDKLVPALAELGKVQKSYLQDCNRGWPGSFLVYDGRDIEAQTFPLDEVRMLYARTRIAHIYGEEERYAPLRKALNSVRHILISHPTLERVFGRVVGRDEFYMGILNTGADTSPADLIAGLFARAQELPGDGFRTAAVELHAFLSRSREERVPGELDVAHDMVLIWGLTLNERIELADGMTLLPFKEIEAYVDQEDVHEYAPRGAGCHQWQGVGAIVRSFHWKPEFYSVGRWRDGVSGNSLPFYREVQAFLELLTVMHETPVLFLATLGNRIHASAGRLLGQSTHSGISQRGRSVEEFDGFSECPALDAQALADAKDAFRHRHSEHYKRLVPIINRLAEALSRDRRFAGVDRILDVAIALEFMYPLKSRGISNQLQSRVSQLLGNDEESRNRYSENVKEFYQVRSKIIHSEFEKLTRQRTREAFTKGFEIARKTLFKFLLEGAPKDWDGSADTVIQTAVQGDAMQSVR